jgi:hypothetical protein
MVVAVVAVIAAVGYREFMPRAATSSAPPEAPSGAVGTPDPPKTEPVPAVEAPEPPSAVPAPVISVVPSEPSATATAKARPVVRPSKPPARPAAPSASAKAPRSNGEISDFGGRR